MPRLRTDAGTCQRRKEDSEAEGKAMPEGVRLPRGLIAANGSGDAWRYVRGFYGREGNEGMLTGEQN